jgi:hypothetical protein
MTYIAHSENEYCPNSDTLFTYFSDAQCFRAQLLQDDPKKGQKLHRYLDKVILISLSSYGNASLVAVTNKRLQE